MVRPFARLVGEWDAHVQVFQGPGAAPNESRGLMVNTLVLGDRYLQQRYQGQSQAMQGIGYWGVDGGACEYVWMDTMSGVMMTGRGEASADILSVAGTVRRPAGQDLNFRSILTILDPDRHAYEIFFTRAGGEEFRSLSITYTRRGG